MRNGYRAQPRGALRHPILFGDGQFHRNFCRRNSNAPAFRVNGLFAGPDNDTIKGFGITFYQRLLAQSDATLTAANLARTEVEEGLKELRAQR
ncbi:MAG: hypothetical protein EPO07_08605 [Verrucomicrobia bacterium]|nr:MAG: hypothetical protein EPO07_08605 [Verrucomicrobiota bacterium]